MFCLHGRPPIWVLKSSADTGGYQRDGGGLQVGLAWVRLKHTVMRACEHQMKM